MASIKERKYFVIDLENILGGSLREADIRLAWSLIHPAINDGDQVLIASGPSLARVALFTLNNENVRFYIRGGAEGADDELLFRTDEVHASGRFGTLVIASGNHKFATMAMRARHAGMRVWQVEGRGTTSKALRNACHVHARLKDPRRTHPRPLGIVRTAA